MKVDLARFDVNPSRTTAARNRSPNTARHQVFKAHVVENATGSAYVELGRTKVTCIVCGPKEPRETGGGARETNADGRLVTTVRRTQYAHTDADDVTARTAWVHYTVPGRRDDAYSSLDELRMADVVTQALTPAVQLVKYRRSVIELNCTIVEDDGGVLPALIMCASLALGDARIEMYDLVTACCVSVTTDGTLVVDVADSERRQTDTAATCVMALLPNMAQVSSVQINGCAPHEHVDALLARAQTACTHAKAPMRQCLIVSG